MYTLVRRFIKTGIMFLFLGLVVVAWMLVRRDLLGIWPNPYLVSVHAHAGGESPQGSQGRAILGMRRES